MTDEIESRTRPIAHPIALFKLSTKPRQMASFLPFQESTDTRFRVSVWKSWEPQR
jgi:hypothetical protein